MCRSILVVNKTKKNHSILNYTYIILLYTRQKNAKVRMEEPGSETQQRAMKRKMMTTLMMMILMMRMRIPRRRRTKKAS